MFDETLHETRCDAVTFHGRYTPNAYECTCVAGRWQAKLEQARREADAAPFALAMLEPDLLREKASEVLSTGPDGTVEAIDPGFATWYAERAVRIVTAALDAKLGVELPEMQGLQRRASLGDGMAALDFLMAENRRYSDEIERLTEALADASPMTLDERLDLYLEVRGIELSAATLPDQAAYVREEAQEVLDAAEAGDLPLTHAEIGDCALALAGTARMLGASVEDCIRAKTEADRGRGSARPLARRVDGTGELINEGQLA